MEKVPLKMQKEECRTGRAGYGQLIIIALMPYLVTLQDFKKWKWTQINR